MSAFEQKNTGCIEGFQVQRESCRVVSNMIGKACALVILTSLWTTPSFAQAAVGGPKKSQNYVGGPVAAKNPIVPPRRGEVVRTEPPTQRLPKR